MRWLVMRSGTGTMGNTDESAHGTARRSLRNKCTVVHDIFHWTLRCFADVCGSLEIGLL